MEGLVQCQQRKGHYPSSALIPVGVIKSQPCPASLLAAALLGDITDDVGDAEEPEKGTLNHENPLSSLRSECTLIETCFQNNKSFASATIEVFTERLLELLMEMFF